MVSGAGGTVEGVSEDSAPEFHDRFSIHPESVEWCRSVLLDLGATEDEVGALTDWEAVRMVEGIHRNAVNTTVALQGLNRSAKGAAGRFAELAEALAPLAAEEAAEELELFLAIDHPPSG